jgi:hypothetical protein
MSYHRTIGGQAGENIRFDRQPAQQAKKSSNRVESDGKDEASTAEAATRCLWLAVYGGGDDGGDDGTKTEQGSWTEVR